MRVALLGDIHANIDYLDSALERAVSQGAKAVIQLGDFGFNFSDGFITRLLEVTDKHGIQLLALRGNHDDPWWFQKYRRMGNVHLIPDGFVTTIGSKRVAFLGGAVSIDRDSRLEHISWWKEERVDPNIISAWLYDNVKADILLSHDSPVLPDKLPKFKIADDILKDCEEDRAYIQMAAEILEPDIIYHGHYHVRHNKFVDLDSKKALVVGLSCDGTPFAESMIILDW